MMALLQIFVHWPVYSDNSSGIDIHICRFFGLYVGSMCAKYQQIAQRNETNLLILEPFICLSNLLR